MSSITYDRVVASAPKAAKAPKGLLRRFFDLLIEARTRQAADVLRQHRHLIPQELEQAGWKISARSEDSLPFQR